MAAFVLAVACLTAILGGCGGKGKNARSPDIIQAEACRPVRCPVPPVPAVDIADLGTDSSRMGRLEEQVVVDATIFAADGGEPVRGRVTVHAGTWLVPAGVFAAPDGQAEKESE